MIPPMLGSQAGAKNFRELIAYARSVMQLLSEMFGVKSTALLHRAALVDSVPESSAPDNIKTFTFQSDGQTTGESPRTPTLPHALSEASSPRTPSSTKPLQGLVDSTKVIDEMLALATVETVHYGAHYTPLAAQNHSVSHSVHRFSRPSLVPTSHV
jgi:type II secretory pathway pseudopilin PulG